MLRSQNCNMCVCSCINVCLYVWIYFTLVTTATIIAIIVINIIIVVVVFLETITPVRTQTRLLFLRPLPEATRYCEELEEARGGPVRINFDSPNLYLRSNLMNCLNSGPCQPTIHHHLYPPTPPPQLGCLKRYTGLWEDVNVLASSTFHKTAAVCSNQDGRGKRICFYSPGFFFLFFSTAVH